MQNQQAYKSLSSNVRNVNLKRFWSNGQLVIITHVIQQVQHDAMGNVTDRKVYADMSFIQKFYKK
jgi:hypothetical protein